MIMPFAHVSDSHLLLADPMFDLINFQPAMCAQPEFHANYFRSRTRLPNLTRLAPVEKFHVGIFGLTQPEVGQLANEGYCAVAHDQTEQSICLHCISCVCRVYQVLAADYCKTRIDAESHVIGCKRPNRLQCMCAPGIR